MTANSKRPNETAERWLQYAEGDLTVAEHEMQRPSPVYHTSARVRPRSSSRDF